MSYFEVTDGIGSLNVNDVELSKYNFNELMFKILVIGDYGVGKTAIIRQYTQGIFDQNYKITIGVDFAIKTINWDKETVVTLQLWDIAGHERFGYLTHVYYKYASAAIIVFDLTRLDTMKSVIKWHNDLKEKITLQNGQSLPVILIANKCDVEGITIPCDLLNQFCKEHNFLAWFFTSAKENINISDSVQHLVQRVLILHEENKTKCLDNQSSVIKLDEKKNLKKHKCC